MSTVKKTAAKKTTTARKRTTPAPVNRARMTEAEAVGAVAKIIDQDGTDAGPKAKPEDAVKVVQVPLYRRGERTGQTRPVRVQRPTSTQVVWFEAAAHRFNLAIEAWGEGVEFTQDERGDVFGEVISAFGVFLATRHDRAWVNSAMAEGILELDGLIEAIEQAKDVLGLAPGQGSNARPEADVVIE